ncbi:MAG: hypothetical protein KJO07_15615, partial [Deltaproteobacteria bacterium]|nr:hypothetical protein [Deltaproteobacteria bacterium]
VVPGAAHIRPADLRQEADEATARGDYQHAAAVLDKLVSYQPLTAGGATRYFGNRAARAELFLQLADLYYDHLDNPKRARESMRRAAEAFGSGARRDATLRLLASEALSSGAPAVAVGSLEAIEPHRLTGNDRLQLARALSKLERDQRAIEVLEQARVRGSLTEEGARMLSHLYRERERKAELAESLERGAKDSPPEIAEVRLREALNLFENALASAEGAERVRQQISELGSATDRVPAAADLERAAEAALEDGDSAVAADLLSRAVHERTRALAKDGESADAALLACLDRLRRVSYTIAPSPDLGGTGHFEALVRALLSAATISSKEAAVSLAREAGSVKRNQLRDPRGAAEALLRVFTSSPDHSALFAELIEALRESGDYQQMIAAYELRLESLEGPARARALRELARIVRSARGESDRVRTLLAEASDVEPEDDDPSAAEREAAGRAELEKGAALEAEGKRDEAVAHYYASFANNPSDPRPLEALDRLYGSLGDSESQANVLGQLVEQTEDPATRAQLWHRRARLYRDHLRRDQDAYRCMKEAYANAPEQPDIAHALRTMAMARSEWPLAAELLYREIACADDDRERAALQLELALIYDEKLIDPEQAIRNYSQALALDPSIPTAPAPLARLYEHVGDLANAADTFELAASLAPGDDTRHNLLRRAAMAADRAGEPEEARRLAAMAGELVAGSDGRSDGLLTALERAEDDDERLDILHRLLDSAQQGGDEAGVRSHARAMLALDGSDSAAFLALKKNAEASEAWETVAELFERRARSVTDPAEKAQLFFELGNCYQEHLSDTPQAVRAFEAAIEAEPEHPGALDALAHIAYLRSDWERARELYSRLDDEVSAMAPELVAFRRGEIAEMLGLDREAAGAFATAVNLAPKNEAALSALIGAAVRMHDLPTAIDAARALLELIPAEDLGPLTAARLQLAQLCDAANDIVTAIYYYEMALAEDPNNRRALESLVTLYAAHGDHQGAIRTLRSLIAIAADLSERAERHYTLGEIYRANVGDHEAAAGEYLKAVDLDPDHAPTLRRLLDYYWTLDDDEALLEIATELHGNDALIVIETPSPTLARVMLAAALSDSALAGRIADSLPGDVNYATASVMIESMEAGRAASADELAEAASWLTEQVAAVSREALADYLGDGEHDGIKAALYAALLGA